MVLAALDGRVERREEHGARDLEPVGSALPRAALADERLAEVEERGADAGHAGEGRRSGDLARSATLTPSGGRARA